MPPRTAKEILAEWHELAMRREEAADTDLADGLAARIEQLRREYIEGTPPQQTNATLPRAADLEPKVQMKFDWLTTPAGRDTASGPNATPPSPTRSDP